MEEQNGRERITEAIEIYIEQYCPENGFVELKAGDIRKWPILKDVFKTTNNYAKEICAAMNIVNYPLEKMDEKIDSTAHIVKYFNKENK